MRAVIRGGAAPPNLPNLLCLLLYALAVGYAALRCQRLSITHDEALTFMAFCSRPWPELFTWDSIGASPNNHFLNTILATASLRAFGVGDVALRLPALLGCLLYCWGTWFALRCLTTGWARVGGAALCVGNAYLLDFFSLSRGYGLGLGCTALGLGLLCRKIGAAPPARLLGLAASGCLAAAVLANLAFANVFLAGALLLAAIEARDCLATSSSGAGAFAHRLARWLGRCCLIVGPAGALLALVYATPVRILQANGQFFFGGERGFFADTLGSLVRAFLYAPQFESMDAALPAALLAGLMLTAGLAAALAGRSLRALAGSPGFGLLLMTCATSASILLQHALFGTLFVIERAAIYFYPLAALTLAGLGGFVIKRAGRRTKAAAGGLLGALAATALAYSLTQVNLTHTRDWRYGACTRAMAERIAADNSSGSSSGKRRALVGTNSLLAPGLVYYIAANNWSWIDWSIHNDAPEAPYSHYLLSQPEIAALAQRRDLALLASCPVSDQRLAAPTP